MKITDKIVTSVTLPQHTNVLWHDPETGELKMFGNKGWEVVGGNPGNDATGGGYPVVTVTEDFNIEAQPNTFYNIKNSADSEVNINCSEGYSVDGAGKHIMFTFDGLDSEELMEFGMYFAYLGGVVVPDTTREGYRYKMEFDFASLSGGQITGIMPAYFTDEIKTGSSVNCLLDMSALGGSAITTPMNNIQILNEDIDYLVWMTHPMVGISPNIFTEVENDNEEYQHKYNIWGLYFSRQTVYTNESYTTATNFYSSDGTDLSSEFSIEVKSNISLSSSDIANEFVFNVNSPANIIFNNEIKWHNNTPPDLEETGTYTLSIVNGVGCYTFVNS